jgi:hypothetical protein
MLFQLLILCACLVTLLIYVEAKARRTAPSCLPNGPRPWLWSLGNLWLVHQLNTHPRRICAGLAHSYGDMTTYWVGQWPTILINSPEDAYELLQKVGQRRGDGIAKCLTVCQHACREPPAHHQDLPIARFVRTCVQTESSLHRLGTIFVAFVRSITACCRGKKL